MDAATIFLLFIVPAVVVSYVYKLTCRHCPKCKTLCSKSATICRACGNELPELRCPGCGVAVGENQTKCTNCGRVVK